MKFPRIFSQAPSVPGSYAERCAEQIETGSGAGALQGRLLAMQATSAGNSPRHRLIRRQLAELGRAADRVEVKAEIARCVQIRRDAVAANKEAQSALKAELQAAQAMVVHRQGVLQQRQQRADPVVKGAQQAAAEALSSAHARLTATQGELERAEAGGDDAAAIDAARRLVEASRQAQDAGAAGRTPEALRAAVLVTQVREARQATEEAEVAVAEVRQRLRRCDLDAALLAADEAAAQYAVACAQVLHAKEAAGLQVRLPQWWTLPRLTVADPDRVPCAKGWIDGFSPKLPESVIVRLSGQFGEVDMSQFEVDPATLSAAHPSADAAAEVAAKAVA